MPKEITHWMLAEKAWAALTPGGLKEVIDKNRALYYFGAVAPDTPYYAPGKSGRVFADAATRYHGLGSDTNCYEPIARVLSTLQYSTDERTWAFLAGVLTHIMADSRFHSLVCHLTGDYRDPDPAKLKKTIAGHHRLESCLDLYNESRVELAFGGRFHRIFAALTMNEKELSALMALFYFGDETSHAEAFPAMIRRQVVMNRRFRNPSWYRTLYLLNKLSRGSIEETLTLFYPPRARYDSAFFEQSFRYVNMENGCNMTASFPDIENQVIESLQTVLRHLGDPCDPEPGRDYFSRTIGPRLI